MTGVQRALGLVRSTRASWLRGLARQVGAVLPFPVPLVSHGRRFFVDLRSAIGRGILATGSFDAPVGDAILGLLRPEGVLIDVGANIGWYSFLAAIRPHAGRIVALEIDQRPVRCLRRTLRANPDLRIEIVEEAADAVGGSAAFRRMPDCGHSALSPDGCGTRVPTTTIDDLVRRFRLETVSVLKIDVEGAEGRVLAGARQTLDRFRPGLVIEFVPDALARFGCRPVEILDLLASHGYRLQYVGGACTPTLLGTPSV